MQLGQLPLKKARTQEKPFKPYPTRPSTDMMVSQDGRATLKELTKRTEA